MLQEQNPCKRPDLSPSRSYIYYKCRCKRCREYSRKHNYKWHLKKRYNLTEEEYKQLGDSCHICGSKDPGDKRARGMFVDHDHKNGKVRGVLCSKCNLGIGAFEDNPLLLSLAIAYLYKHQFNSEVYSGSIETTFERSH